MPTHTCTLHTCTIHTCTLHTRTIHTCTLHTCTPHTHTHTHAHTHTHTHTAGGPTGVSMATSKWLETWTTSVALQQEHSTPHFDLYLFTWDHLTLLAIYIVAILIYIIYTLYILFCLVLLLWYIVSVVLSTHSSTYTYTIDIIRLNSNSYIIDFDTYYYVNHLSYSSMHNTIQA